MAPKPQSPAAEVGEQLIGGRNSRKLSTVKTGIDFDTQSFDKLDKRLAGMGKTIQGLTKDTKALTAALNQAAGASSKIQPPGGGSPGTPANPNAITPKFNNTSGTAPTAGSPTPPPGGPGGPSGRSPFGGMYEGMASKTNVTLAAGYVGGQMVSGLDNRIDRGKSYASSADKLNVLTQQMTGMSQMQVMNNVRRPLANYRLGAGGINALHNFQNQTGFAASPQLARSIEGIHTMSGYTKDAGAVLQDQMALMNPETSNRMFNMTGISAIGFGGKMNDPLKMRMDLAKRFGMTNSNIAQASLAPGSRTRAIMSDSGIPQELQDEIIQMGMAQNSFKKKGGKGDYDPSNKRHREIAGIEKNLATQEQETDRLRDKREEDFSRRQLDNMATAEEIGHRQIEILASIEDKLSAIVGARTSTGGWQKWAGRAMQVGGVALMATGAGVGAGAALAGAGTVMAGDPPAGASPAGPGARSGQGNTSSANDDSIMVPSGYGGKRRPLSEVAQGSSFKKLKPQMQERLKSMMRENPNVGVGEGFRDPEAQKRMFLDRHVVTTKGNHDRVWNGKYWKLVKGAPAAPPGSSMHEIGMAADLVGDLKWMNANASRFGLKHFAGVNGEPWHVQPIEFPNSRSAYEAGGAEWGTGEYSGESAPPDGTTSGRVTTDNSGDGHAPSLDGYSGMSISEVIDAYVHRGFSGTAGSHSKKSADTATSAVGGTYTSGGAGGGSLEGLSGATLAARAAYNAGFRGNDLVQITAIAGRESGWDPRAINQSSQDTGMWQIAPMNFGKYSQAQLLNADNNAKVARSLFDGGGWSGWTATDSRHKVNGVWKVDPSGKGGPGWAKDGDPMWHARQHLPAAQAAVESIGASGDPMYKAGPVSSPSSPTHLGASRTPGSPVTISTTPVIHVSPTINFHGTPQTQDLKSIAQELNKMIEDSARQLDMRNA